MRVGTSTADRSIGSRERCQSTARAGMDVKRCVRSYVVVYRAVADVVMLMRERLAVWTRQSVVLMSYWIRPRRATFGGEGGGGGNRRDARCCPAASKVERRRGGSGGSKAASKHGSACAFPNASTLRCAASAVRPTSEPSSHYVRWPPKLQSQPNPSLPCLHILWKLVHIHTLSSPTMHMISFFSLLIFKKGNRPQDF